MNDAVNVPWLTIIGWGENGISALSPASLEALNQAEVIFGARRHLQVLPEMDAEVREWPAPFADGIPMLLEQRHRRVVMLVSGDPFWFGAGTVIARHLPASEMQAHPGPSTFSLAAARLGWALETTGCLGLHAAPLNRIRPYLQPGQRLLVLLRDGDAVSELMRAVNGWGFGASRIHILEALGGERERIRTVHVREALPNDIQHPVAVAMEVAGTGPAIPLSGGLADEWFEHDGQITKQPVRAVTLSALAPCAGERLWDIGTGSGSVAIEWLLSHPGNQAIGFEVSSERAARTEGNAKALGVDRLQVICGQAPDALAGQPIPDAVFIGGGLSPLLLEALWKSLPIGTRIVANAVTLESEALLFQWHEQKGGELLRLALSTAGSIGPRRGWKAAYPIVQWRVKR